MITNSGQKSKERGHFDHGWLNTYHTFSFDQYYDPRYMGFRSLRVINEDFVAPVAGFRRTDIATWRSSLTFSKARCKHEDSMGNGSVIRPGDVQRMTRGHRRATQREECVVAERVHCCRSGSCRTRSISSRVTNRKLSLKTNDAGSCD